MAQLLEELFDGIGFEVDAARRDDGLDGLAIPLPARRCVKRLELSQRVAADLRPGVPGRDQLADGVGPAASVVAPLLLCELAGDGDSDRSRLDRASITIGATWRIKKSAFTRT